MVIFWLVMFAVGMYVLIRASSYFLYSAERFGYTLGIPSYLVGVTIVSLGTTLPELASSVISMLNGAREVPAGIVVGSLVTNIFLVLAVSAIYAGHIHITKKLARADLILLIGATTLLALALRDGVLSRPESWLFLAAFLVYLFYAITLERTAGFGKVVPEGTHHKFGSRMIWALVIPPIFIYAGAELTILSLTTLSEILNVGRDVLGATALAFGTSLPELVVSVSAITRGKSEIAVGNILGSNIINATGVMGIAGLIGTPIVAAHMVSVGIPMMLAAAALYYVIVREDAISQWEGWMLLLFYAYYLGELAIF